MDIKEAFPDSDLTRSVIGAFFAVYNNLRWGFLEAVYAGALAIELEERGIPFRRSGWTCCTRKRLRASTARISSWSNGSSSSSRRASLSATPIDASCSTTFVSRTCRLACCCTSVPLSRRSFGS